MNLPSVKQQVQRLTIEGDGGKSKQEKVVLSLTKLKMTTAEKLEKAPEEVEYDVEAILKEKKATGKGRKGKVMSRKFTP